MASLIEPPLPQLNTRLPSTKASIRHCAALSIEASADSLRKRLASAVALSSSPLRICVCIDMRSTSTLDAVLRLWAPRLCFPLSRAVPPAQLLLAQRCSETALCFAHLQFGRESRRRGFRLGLWWRRRCLGFWRRQHWHFGFRLLVDVVATFA